MNGTVTPIRRGPPVPPQSDWKKRLCYSQTRRGDEEIVDCPANAVTILRNDAAWRGVLAYNLLSQAIVCRSPPPWFTDPMCIDDAPADDNPARPWSDSDGARVQNFLQRRWDLKVSESTAYRAAMIVAEANTFDPLVEFIDSLEWDGHERIDKWLNRYMGVEDSPYSRLVGRIFLVGSIARALNPGCKFDTMMVWEGAQDAGKSTAAEALFGAEYFRHTPIDLRSNDRFLAMQGCWCREWPELDGHGKTDERRVKSFLSATVDDFRAPYGRNMVHVPRRCVLLATVNPPQLGYLVDETGNRRLLPVVCGAVGPIVHDAIRDDRLQLWAEAREMYLRGVKCFPATPAEKRLCNGEQESRMVSEVWSTKIETWLKVNKSAEDAEVTIPEIMAGPLGIPTERQDHSAECRVGKALARIGWHVVRRDGGGARERYYGRKSDAPRPTPDDEERAALSDAPQ